MQIALLLVGFGHVGRRFVELLDESKAALAALNIEPVVVGIATARHGGVFDEAGLDAVEAARRRATGGTVSPNLAPPAREYLARLCRQSIETRVMVETTTLNIQSGEPAVGHVREALAAGVHVITANKGPAAFAYRALQQMADRAGVSWLFEGAVMDGVPIFNLVRETLPAVTVNGVRGVINSTTNHILTAMERGEPYDAALARMQAAGVAEADPSLDVEGWDAAAKIAALANALLDADLTPRHVWREGIGPGVASRVLDARSAGRRLKLVAHARGRGATVEAAVELMALDASDPLAGLEDQGNAVEFDTWPLGRIVVIERDGGLEKTAYALLGDLITVARRVQARAGAQVR